MTEPFSDDTDTNVINFSDRVEFDVDFTNEFEIAENIIPRYSELEHHSYLQEDEISLTSLNMGKVFDTEENAHFYTRFYAQTNGFAVGIKNKTLRKEGSLSARFYMCSFSQKCPFSVLIRHDLATNLWRFTSLKDDYNHTSLNEVKLFCLHPIDFFQTKSRIEFSTC